jgi:hypothetical protein
MSEDRDYLKHSVDSDDFDDQPRRNCCRVLFVFILAVLALGSTITLAIVLYKDAVKEKALTEKKKGWAQKWLIVKPYVKSFPLGFVLGFIRNLIILAIERQSGLEETNI